VDLAERIDLIIQSNNHLYFPKASFADFFGQSISLGVVGANSLSEYSWIANFQAESGNDYQNTNVAFNFNLNFTCGSAPIISNTPVPTTIQFLRNNTSNNQNTTSTSVLGLETDNVELGLDQASVDDSVNGGVVDTGNIMGIECESNYNWWIVLLIQSVLSVIVLSLKLIRTSLPRLWSLPLLFGLLSQAVHTYFGCGCSEGYWCSKYIYLNLLVVIVVSLCYFLINHLKLNREN
jgi:hypothetical protein